MRGARYRFPIVVERNTPTQDSFGDEVDSWGIFAIRRADILPLRGREWWAADVRSGDVTHRIMMRYDTLLITMTTKDRIAYESRYFDIKSIILSAGRTRELEVMAIERL